MTKRKALVTGATGQIGSYLCEILLEKDYEVYVLNRRTSNIHLDNIKHIINQVTVVPGDITDYAVMYNLIDKIRPHEIYNLAAQSFVALSYEMPLNTFESVALGPLNILEAVRNIDRNIKVYQSSSSEMYGNSIDQDGFQRETTRFMPRSPYAVAKLAAHQNVFTFRESYGMFACANIVFNSESPRRGLEFVTRKITNYIGSTVYSSLQWELGSDVPIIMLDDIPPLELGNLDSYRDWSFAYDTAMAMYLTMQSDKPSDYVVASGECHSIREFLDVAFGCVGLEWDEFVVSSSKHMRPSEVNKLCGDSSRIRKELGWAPTKNFNELVQLMVQSDIRLSNALSKAAY
jgi:GDPmannose 4,6-dehydratase